MSEQSKQPRKGTIDDLILDSTITYWWERKKLILPAMLAAMVLFAVGLLLIPEQYRAQASVIIMPPRFIPEVRTQPLTVTTAQSLLQTHELYQQVINQLRRHREIVLRLAGEEKPNDEALREVANLTPQEITAAIGSAEDEAEIVANYDLTELTGLSEFDEDELQDMTVDSMAKMLSSEEAVEKKTASELTYSPVLQLFGVADTGNKAQVLVNIWARLFEQKYETVTRGQTQRLYESLENQQEAGQKELEDIQQILVKFKLENNLDLIQRQISDYTDSYSSYSQQLLRRSNELVGLTAQLNTLTEMVSALEAEDGGWIGGVQVDQQTTGISNLSFLAHALEDDDILSITLLRRESMRSRSDLIHAMDRAALFQSENPLQILTAEEERLRKEYLEQTSEYRTSLVRSKVAARTLAELDQRIEETSSSLSLSTALPEEVVGQALVNSSSQVGRAASLQLRREEINPLWQTLVNNRAEIARQLAEAEAAIAELSAVLPVKKAELDELAQKLYETIQADKMMALHVDRYTKVNENLFDHFSAMKNELFQSASKVTLLQEEILSLQDAIEKTRTEIDRQRESYEAAAAQVEILNLRKKAVEQRADLLTQKLQESLVAVGEEVSDVSLASKAVPPTQHFFPPRTILFGVMTLVTAGLLLGGLSRRRYLELAAARGYREV